MIPLHCPDCLTLCHDCPYHPMVDSVQSVEEQNQLFGNILEENEGADDED